jgi:hypothetical protein
MFDYIRSDSEERRSRAQAYLLGLGALSIVNGVLLLSGGGKYFWGASQLLAGVWWVFLVLRGRTGRD